MRWVIGVLFGLTLAPSAFAGDLDFLRGSQPVGPPTYANWSGFYVGGQFGVSDANADFSNATSAPIAYSLRETVLEDDFAPSEWPILGTGDQTGPAYGGFVGYNTQWQDVIVGFEANYNHTSLLLNAPSSSISRLTAAGSNGDTYSVQLSGTGTLSDLDYGTLRMRGGYILGDFLPYGFVGFALGHADVNVTANVSGEQNPPASGGACLLTNTPPCTPFAYSSTAGRNGAWLYGAAIGGGLDVALTQNIFLRGEFEYIRFAPFSDVVIAIASARVGAGLKF